MKYLHYYDVWYRIQQINCYRYVVQCNQKSYMHACMHIALIIMIMVHTVLTHFYDTSSQQLVQRSSNPLSLNPPYNSRDHA